MFVPAGAGSGTVAKPIWARIWLLGDAAGEFTSGALQPDSWLVWLSVCAVATLPQNPPITMQAITNCTPIPQLRDVARIMLVNKVCMGAQRRVVMSNEAMTEAIHEALRFKHSRVTALPVQRLQDGG